MLIPATHSTYVTNKRHNAMQGGMWNGRASRRTRVSESKLNDKSSAGIGTTVEHPPCERMPDSRHSGRAQRPSPTPEFSNRRATGDFEIQQAGIIHYNNADMRGRAQRPSPTPEFSNRRATGDFEIHQADIIHCNNADMCGRTRRSAPTRRNWVPRPFDYCVSSSQMMRISSP